MTTGLEKEMEYALREANERKPMTFELGDCVTWCGVEGVVTEIEPNLNNPVMVVFNGDEFHAVAESFFPDGRYRSFHTEPSLKLVRRGEKKRVKRTYYLPVTKMDQGGSVQGTYLFKNKQAAINEDSNILGTIAVEVECEE